MDQTQTVETIRQHHAHLVADLQAHVDLLGQDVSAGRDHHESAQEVAALLETQIYPHAAGEEQAIYPLAARRAELRPLVEVMIAEHRYLQSTAAAITHAADPVGAVGAAQAAATVFALHADKENDHLLPALAADPTVDLEAALGDMHRLLETTHKPSEDTNRADRVVARAS
jgi:hypothetical protein